MKASNCLILFLAINWLGCKKDVPPADLIRYVINPENGLMKSKAVGDIIVEVQHTPAPYIIASSLRKNKISTDEFAERQEGLEKSQQYIMKLKVRDGHSDITTYKVNNESEHQQRLYYLSFHMEHDIKLIDGRDTLGPRLFHFERSYDLAPHRTFVITFERKKGNQLEDKTFILDSPMFGTGPIKLKFSSQDINNIPDLKLEQ